MNFKAFSPHKYLFIMTLTASIKWCEKVNLFKPNTPQRQKDRFVSHSPYYPVVRLNAPRAYIRTPLKSLPFKVQMFTTAHKPMKEVSYNVQNNSRYFYKIMQIKGFRRKWERVEWESWNYAGPLTWRLGPVKSLAFSSCITGTCGLDWETSLVVRHCGNWVHGWAIWHGVP